MSLNGCIFGWILFGDKNIPIAHHAGLILSWNEYDPWESIVGHYGINSIGKVRVETLRVAVRNSNVNIVKINPYYKATFQENSFYIDDTGIHPGDELVRYGEEHPIYDIWFSNCQHFVKHFMGPIRIESDIYEHIPNICSTIVQTGIFGSKYDIQLLFKGVADTYQKHRDRGICHWDDSLDMYSPWWKS